jgi:hypothetical protein
MQLQASSHPVSPSLVVQTRASRRAQDRSQRVKGAVRSLELLSLGIVLLLLALVLGHHLHALWTGEAASDAPALSHD